VFICRKLSSASPISVTLSTVIIPLNTKRRQLYLKIQTVPSSKHFASRL